MTKQELQAVVDNPLSTPEQRSDAEKLLNTVNSKSTHPFLVAMRRKLLNRWLAENTEESKQHIKDWSHNWPDFATTGKVLGE